MRLMRQVLRLDSVTAEKIDLNGAVYRRIHLNRCEIGELTNFVLIPNLWDIILESLKIGPFRRHQVSLLTADGGSRIGLGYLKADCGTLFIWPSTVVEARCGSTVTDVEDRTGQ